MTPPPIPQPVQQQNQSSNTSIPVPQVTSTLIDHSHQYYHKYNIGTALVSTVSSNSLISSNGAALTSSTNLIQQNNNSNQQLKSAIQHSSSQKISQYSANFWENYEHLCALQNLMPLQSLKACLSIDGGANLNLNVDKLKSADWEPLLNTMRVNKNLKIIQFHSNYVAQNENDPKSVGYAKLKKPPSIRNKDRTNKLCRSLKECFSISHYLSKLELYNIPLSVKDCAQIAKGFRVNKSIKILSLDRCMIGDEGLSVICKDIQSSSNLNRVNFSACNLTHEGASILASLIKVQALKRHNEAWKDSLRYGRPDLDSMFGIRRITINSNQMIGDKGVQYLADAFKSDLWLKALDLQDCGITTQGAKYLLDGLKFNAMMHVLDVRLNVNIDRDTLQKIMEQVMINSSGNNTDYEWMDLSQTAVASISTKSASSSQNNSNNSGSNKQQLANINVNQVQPIKKSTKKRRNTNISFNKRPINQISSSINSLSKLKRCKSTGSVVFNKSPPTSDKKKSSIANQGSGSGIPWRAAARAERYRVSSSCAYRNILNELDQDEEDGQIMSDKEEVEEIEEDDLINNLMTSLTFDNDKFVTSSFAAHNNKQQKQQQSRKSNDFAANLNKIKNVSVKDLLAILQKEQESKTQLEDMLLQFKEENTKLKAQISMLKSKLDHQQNQIEILKQKNPNNTTSMMNRTLLDDDKALEIIERAFQKYQNFLDFLRNAGFGQLIDIGEMHQIDKTNVQEEYETDGIVSKINPINEEEEEEDGLSDQQKYYMNKINKTKSKLSNKSSKKLSSSSKQRGPRELAGDETNADENNIDALLSNALEISKSYRRFNSSIINSTGIYPQKQNPNINNNETTLLKENIDNLEQTTEMLLTQYQHIRKSNKQSNNEQKSQKQGNKLISPLSNKSTNNLDELNSLHVDINQNNNINNIQQHHSTASTSPQTTVVTNHKQQVPPPVSSRSTSVREQQVISYQHEDEDDEENNDDKEIEDDNVSEVISEDSKYYFDDDVNQLQPVTSVQPKNTVPNQISSSSTNNFDRQFVLNRRKLTNDPVNGVVDENDHENDNDQEDYEEKDDEDNNDDDF
jgi:centrosomal protein CEP78